MQHKAFRRVAGQVERFGLGLADRLGQFQTGVGDGLEFNAQGGQDLRHRIAALAREGPGVLHALVIHIGEVHRVDHDEGAEAVGLEGEADDLAAQHAEVRGGHRHGLAVHHVEQLHIVADDVDLLALGHVDGRGQGHGHLIGRAVHQGAGIHGDVQAQIAGAAVDPILLLAKGLLAGLGSHQLHRPVGDIGAGHGDILGGEGHQLFHLDDGEDFFLGLDRFAVIGQGDRIIGHAGADGHGQAVKHIQGGQAVVDRQQAIADRLHLDQRAVHRDLAHDAFHLHANSREDVGQQGALLGEDELRGGSGFFLGLGLDFLDGLGFGLGLGRRLRAGRGLHGLLHRHDFLFRLEGLFLGGLDRLLLHRLGLGLLLRQGFDGLGRFLGQLLFRFRLLDLLGGRGGSLGQLGLRLGLLLGGLLRQLKLLRLGGQGLLQRGELFLRQHGLGLDRLFLGRLLQRSFLNHGFLDDLRLNGLFLGLGDGGLLFLLDRLLALGELLFLSGELFLADGLRGLFRNSLFRNSLLGFRGGQEGQVVLLGHDAQRKAAGGRTLGRGDAEHQAILAGVLQEDEQLVVLGDEPAQVTAADLGDIHHQVHAGRPQDDVLLPLHLDADGHDGLLLRDLRAAAAADRHFAVNGLRRNRNRRGLSRRSRRGRGFLLLLLHGRAGGLRLRAIQIGQRVGQTGAAQEHEQSQDQRQETGLAAVAMVCVHDPYLREEESLSIRRSLPPETPVNVIPSKRAFPQNAEMHESIKFVLLYSFSAGMLSPAANIGQALCICCQNVRKLHICCSIRRLSCLRLPDRLGEALQRLCTLFARAPVLVPVLPEREQRRRDQERPEENQQGTGTPESLFHRRRLLLPPLRCAVRIYNRKKQLRSGPAGGHPKLAGFRCPKGSHALLRSR